MKTPKIPYINISYVRCVNGFLGIPWGIMNSRNPEFLNTHAGTDGRQSFKFFLKIIAYSTVVIYFCKIKVQKSSFLHHKKCQKSFLQESIFVSPLIKRRRRVVEKVDKVGSQCKTPDSVCLLSTPKPCSKVGA